MDETDKLKEMRSALNARLFLLILGVLLVLNGVTSTGRNGLAYRNLAAAIDERIVLKETLPDKKESDDNRAEERAAAEDAAENADKTAVDADQDTADADQNDKKAADAGQNAGSESDSGKQNGSDNRGNETAGTEQSAEEQLDSFILQMDEVGMTTGDLRRISVFFLVAAFFEIVVGLICAILSNRVDRAKITFTAVCILLVVELVFLIFMTLNNGLMLSMLINCLLIPIALLWSSWKMLKLSKADPSRKYAAESRRTAGPRPEAPSPAPAPPRSIKDRAMWQTETEPSLDEAEIGAETETEAETKTGTDAEAETKAETETEAETKAEARTEAETKAGTDVGTETRTETS